MPSPLHELCVHELADIVRGDLMLGDMPPLDGAWQPVSKMVTEIDKLDRGEIYLDLTPGAADQGVSDAILRAMATGATGVITARPHIEPWAGTFVIQVADGPTALLQLAQWIRNRFRGMTIAVVGSKCESVLTTLEALLHVVTPTLRLRPDDPNDPTSCARSWLEIPHARGAILLGTTRQTGVDCNLSFAAPDLLVDQSDRAQVDAITRDRLIAALAYGARIVSHRQSEWSGPVAIEGEIESISAAENWHCRRRGDSVQIKLEDVTVATVPDQGDAVEVAMLVLTSLAQFGLTPLQLHDAWDKQCPVIRRAA